MAYDPFELSTSDGAPIELYDFRIGGEAYALCTAPGDVTYDSIVYSASQVKRDTIGLSPDERTAILQVTLPATHPLPRKYINMAPGQRGTLTIRRAQRFDTDNQLIVIFKGIIRSVAFSTDGLTSKIALMPISGALSRPAPRFTYQGLCNHVLYDTGCTVASSLFRYINTVTAVSGNQLTINGLSVKPDNWATGGFALFGGIDYRLILSHTGDDVRLLLPFDVSPIGQSIEIYAGCAHDLPTCKDKFDNVINYGGFAFVPLRNPFATGIGSA